MDAARFATLMDGHAAKLMLYARQWTDAPEDAVQEAFLKLVRQREEPADPVAWLFRVVRNAALDAGKGQRRRSRRESAAARPVVWFNEPAVDGLDADDAVAALERLPPDQREVIVARLWGGLGFEQIAAVAGCSASSAHRRFTAGIETLRRILGEPCHATRSNA
jgi:RNA polymerase sigma-70 factor (ECF subfamily)